MSKRKILMNYDFGKEIDAFWKDLYSSQMGYQVGQDKGEITQILKKEERVCELTDNVENIKSCLDKILVENEDLFLHKNFNINGIDVFYMNENRFFVNGNPNQCFDFKYSNENGYIPEQDIYSISRNEFKELLAIELDKKGVVVDEGFKIYSDDNDIAYNMMYYRKNSYSEEVENIISVIKEYDDISLGDKIKIISFSNFNENLDHVSEGLDPVRNVIFSDMQNGYDSYFIDEGSICNWKDFIQDGSVDIMIDCLSKNPEYFNIIDFSGKTCLDSAIDDRNLNLADELSKIGALSCDDVEKAAGLDKDKDKDKSNDQELVD